MTTLREAAQQALEALIWTTGSADFGEGGQAREGALKLLFPSIDALRAALKQEEEASAWLAERKEHWRKEREKAQAAKDQDPELSAALGWPGGISNPVLDRRQLLQMVAALRVSAQQALEALEAMQAYAAAERKGLRICDEAIAALRIALAQPDDWTRCHHCGQTMPPVPLTGLDMFLDPQDGLKPKRYKPKAEPVQEPIRLDCSSPLVVHPHPAFQTTPPKAEPVVPVAWMCSNPELMAKGYERFASRCEGDWNIPVYTSPPQRQPLTDEVAALTAQRDALLKVLKYLDKAFRQHGRQHWPEAVRVAAAIKAVEGTK